MAHINNCFLGLFGLDILFPNFSSQSSWGPNLVLNLQHVYSFLQVVNASVVETKAHFMAFIWYLELYCCIFVIAHILFGSLYIVNLIFLGSTHPNNITDIWCGMRFTSCGSWGSLNVYFCIFAERMQPLNHSFYTPCMAHIYVVLS